MARSFHEIVTGIRNKTLEASRLEQEDPNDISYFEEDHFQDSLYVTKNNFEESFTQLEQNVLEDSSQLEKDFVFHRSNENNSHPEQEFFQDSKTIPEL